MVVLNIKPLMKPTDERLQPETRDKNVELKITAATVVTTLAVSLQTNSLLSYT